MFVVLLGVFSEFSRPTQSACTGKERFYIVLLGFFCALMREILPLLSFRLWVVSGFVVGFWLVFGLGGFFGVWGFFRFFCLITN